MKRPLCFVGISMIVTLTFLTAFGGQDLLLCTLVFSTLLFLLSLIYKKTRKALYLPFILFAVILSCVFLLSNTQSYDKITAFADDVCTVKVTLKETPSFSTENVRFYCVGKVHNINGEKVNSNIKLSFYENPDLKADDEFIFDAYIYKTGSSIKTVENYYKSDRIFIGAYNIENIRIIKSGFKGYYYYTEKIKDCITHVFLEHLDMKSAGLMISLLTGDKTYLDGEVNNNFRRSGVSHLMAVSGMHLSVWVIFFGFLIDRKSKHKLISNFTMLFIVLFVMILASFSGSVKRAGFMCMLHFLGKLISKNSDSLNSLGFSVTVILILNPYSVYDVGFILSFLSTLSILVAALPTSAVIIKRINALKISLIYKKILSSIAVSICISFFVSVFTLPVVIISFGYINTVSILTNLLFLPVNFLLILSAGLLVIFSKINFIAYILSLICTAFAQYAIHVTDYIAKFKYATIPADNEVIILWLIVMCAFSFAFLFKSRRKQIVKIAAVFSVIITMLFTTVTFSKNLTAYTLYLIPAEEKLSVLVSCNGQGVLVGYHDSYYFEENVMNILQRNNITLHAVIANNTKKARDFVKKNKIEHYLTQSGESISVMNTVEISNNCENISIKGNNTTFEIINEECLQQKNEYDIILYNYYTVDITNYYGDFDILSQHVIIDNNTNGYIKVYSDSEYKTGGETVG